MCKNRKRIVKTLFLVLVVNNFTQAYLTAEEIYTPVFSNLEWRDNNGSSIDKAHTLDIIKIYSEIQGVPEGTAVQVRITNFYEDYDEQDFIDLIECEVINSKIEIEWKVAVMATTDTETNFANEIAVHGYAKLDYHFEILYGGFNSTRSGPLNVRGWMNVRVLHKDDGKARPNIPVSVHYPNGEIIRTHSDEDGYIRVYDIIYHGLRYLIFD
jgi:hypothetical protein